MAIERDHQQQSGQPQQTAAKPTIKDVPLNAQEPLGTEMIESSPGMPVNILGRSGILALQRTVGNRAVQRILAKKQSPSVSPASSTIARKPADVERAKTAATAADAESKLAVTAKERAEDRGATADAAATALAEAKAHQVETDRQVGIFDAALKLDSGAIGWKQMAAQAKQRAASAVEKAKTVAKQKQDAEAALTLAEKAATTASTEQVKAKNGTTRIEGLLTTLRSKEQEIYTASTTKLALTAAGAVAKEATVIANGRAACAALIVKIETAVGAAKTAVSTVETALAGMPILTKIQEKRADADVSLALAKDSMAVVELIAQHAAQTATRAAKVAKAKEEADQKANAARLAQKDADKQGGASKAAEKAAKQFADLAQQAQVEAQRVDNIKTAADALAKSEAEAHAKAEATAKNRTFDAEAEPYIVKLYTEEDQSKVDTAASRKAKAESEAEAAVEPKRQADLQAADASKVSQEAEVKAKDAAKIAADAASKATSTKDESTIAASERDVTQATAQSGATADVQAFAQQERLRALAGGQIRVNELSTTITDLDKLEALLTRFGYDLLKKLLGLTPGLNKLENLVVRVPDKDQLDQFLTKLGYVNLDSYLKLPITPAQISDLMTRIPVPEMLIRLMTKLGYDRLDRMIKLPQATPSNVETAANKVNDNTKLDTLVTALGIKLLEEYLTGGATVTQVENFVTKLPDAAKRTIVLTACDKNATLVDDLLTKTNNDASGLLSVWLAPDGGHKAVALNTYLSDATRQADQTKIWSSSQTIAESAVPVTSPPPPPLPAAAPPAMTIAKIVTIAVAKKGTSGPLINGYAGNRAWGKTVKPGDAVLPQYTTAGGAITYTEYDIHPYTGANRGSDRVVIGSDGSKYYTGDHYGHFRRIV